MIFTLHGRNYIARERTDYQAVSKSEAGAHDDQRLKTSSLLYGRRAWSDEPAEKVAWRGSPAQA